MGTPRYRLRLVDPLLDELLEQVPAVIITGPRVCGKTTTASRRARTVVQLASEAQAAAFAADPDAALRGLPEPVLLDEWQADRASSARLGERWMQSRSRIAST